MVRLLTFYSERPSSNPAEIYGFLKNLFGLAHFDLIGSKTSLIIVLHELSILFGILKMKQVTTTVEMSLHQPSST